MLQPAVEADTTFGECVLQSLLDLPSKNPSQHLLGQKEPVARIGAHPALMVERQSAGRDDTVHVGMMLHGLGPGMEHTEESDLGAEAFGIAGDFDQCFSTEAQQHRIDELLVLQRELGQKTRHRENDVGIGDGKKFFLPPVDPTKAGIGLTLWTMPVTARVVRVAGIAATGALIDMVAESSGAAADDRS